jgi:glutamate formiminotransferase/formiminotetrahydrofolate cyclodeaminase
MGAFLNVKINTKDLDDKKWVADIMARGKELQEKATLKESDLLERLEKKL